MKIDIHETSIKINNECDKIINTIMIMIREIHES